MSFKERALRFSHHDSWLYGILSLPEQAAARGVLLVVGGPQYRVGSHRQFTLLARYLAAQGIPVMRFDFRGMGDSEGEMRTFEAVEEDIHYAVEQFFKEMASLKEVVIWGLCDAASAALFYAHQDQRITGLVLLNPWVRTEQGMARAYLKHYYLARLFTLEFWKKIGRGRFNYIATIRSFLKLTRNSLLKNKELAMTAENGAGNVSDMRMPLPDRMLHGLSRFKGRILVITSGNDLTAQEFLDLVKGSSSWQKYLSGSHVKQFNLAEANHTFSRREWRDQVATWTRDWIKSW